MTIREFYKNVMDGNLTEDVMVKASELLEKHDEANAKRAQKVLEKKASAEDEKAPIRQALLAQVSDEAKCATQLIADAGLTDEVKPASVPSLLKPFVVNGTIVKTDVKVDGKKMRGYVLA